MQDLSIIIPHFNSIEKLKTLLTSVPVSQNIQVIVVDDQSTQGREEYECLKKNDSFKYVEFLCNNTQDKGAGVCRNIGFEKALGNWVLFADSDDFFLPDFYKKINSYFSSECDVIFFPPTSWDVETKKVSYRHNYYEKIMSDYLKNPNHKNDLYVKYRIEVPWSKMIKRVFIKDNDILFDHTLVSNDVMFSIKVGYHLKNFVISSEKIYCVTESKGSLTKLINKHSFETRLDIFIKMYKYIEEKLNTEDFKMLSLSAMPMIINAIKYKYNVIYIIKTVLKLRRENIKILKKDYVRPMYLIKKIKEYYKNFNQERKNYVK